MQTNIDSMFSLQTAEQQTYMCISLNKRVWIKSFCRDSAANPEAGDHIPIMG